MQLGRLGAWYSTDKLGGPQQIKTFVQTVERLGYGTLWYLNPVATNPSLSPALCWPTRIT